MYSCNLILLLHGKRKLISVGGSGPTLKALILQDLLAAFFVMTLLASAWTNSLMVAAMSGLILGKLVVIYWHLIKFHQTFDFLVHTYLDFSYL